MMGGPERNNCRVLPANEQRSKLRLFIAENHSQLSEKAAEFLADRIEKKQGDCFTVAFSGGATPRGLFQTLARDPYFSRISWENLDSWWVDERCVSFDSPESNYGNARHDLIRKIAAGPDRIHPMPAEQDPGKGAAAYEAALMRSFGIKKGSFPVFDLIFLGVGEDGHVASLFPGDDVLDEDKKLVAPVKGGNPRMDRLTMTFPVLNHARDIVFMASGKQKAGVVKAAVHPSDPRLPVHMIRPHAGRITWIVDREAAEFI
jgi:6-phosphogluconolactonase